MKGKYNLPKYYLMIWFRLRIIINSVWRYLRYVTYMSASLKHNFLHSNRMIHGSFKNWFIRINSKNRFSRTRFGHHVRLHLESDLSGIFPYIHPDCLKSQGCQVWFIRTEKLKPCQHHLLSSMKREVA